mmetsp:Transcript_12632/g.36260  ORF Transcript_12632/g.36260 Transcript_12632/m.36260 type:complete len:306 (+) Transcript_12632:522-1439(+)
MLRQLLLLLLLRLLRLQLRQLLLLLLLHDVVLLLCRHVRCGARRHGSTTRLKSARLHGRGHDGRHVQPRDRAGWKPAGEAARQARHHGHRHAGTGRAHEHLRRAGPTAEASVEGRLVRHVVRGYGGLGRARSCAQARTWRRVHPRVLRGRRRGRGRRVGLRWRRRRGHAGRGSGFGQGRRRRDGAWRGGGGALGGVRGRRPEVGACVLRAAVEEARRLRAVEETVHRRLAAQGVEETVHGRLATSHAIHRRGHQPLGLPLVRRPPAGAGSAATRGASARQRGGERALGKGEPPRRHGAARGLRRC